MCLKLSMALRFYSSKLAIKVDSIVLFPGDLSTSGDYFRGLVPPWSPVWQIRTLGRGTIHRVLFIIVQRYNKRTNIAIQAVQVPCATFFSSYSVNNTAPKVCTLARVAFPLLVQRIPHRGHQFGNSCYAACCWNSSGQTERP